MMLNCFPKLLHPSVLPPAEECLLGRQFPKEPICFILWLNPATSPYCSLKKPNPASQRNHDLNPDSYALVSIPSSASKFLKLTC